MDEVRERINAMLRKFLDDETLNDQQNWCWEILATDVISNKLFSRNKYYYVELTKYSLVCNMFS